MSLAAVKAKPKRRLLAPDRSLPPGLIGVLCADTARFSMFSASLSRTQVPPGSDCQHVIGNDITEGANNLVRAMRPTDEWLWILGDDHAWPPYLLPTLLKHDVDIVVPLTLTRLPPFEPVIYTDWYDETHSVRRRLRLEDHPDGGLVRIHSAGSAGMLIRRQVLDTIGDPWFRKYPVNGDYLAEDLYFCDMARDAGFSIYADLDSPFGHITSSIVWPQHHEEGWSFGFKFPDGFTVSMPVGTWITEDAA